jgi:hypothetical protein
MVTPKDGKRISKIDSTLIVLTIILFYSQKNCNGCWKMMREVVKSS